LAYFNFYLVVFLENELLYGVSFPVSSEVLSEDFVLPIGKAKIERAGEHVTLVSYSMSTRISLQAAEELEKIGVSAEVCKVPKSLFIFV
jgi:pyruvate dehydrogenase E1 component beta subunit